MFFLNLILFLTNNKIVKKFFNILLICFIMIFSITITNAKFVIFASPENTLNQINLAEKLLIKLQNSEEFDEEIEKIYKYLDIVCHENTQFFSYNIEKLEKLMDNYRNNIILKARDMANNKEFKNAVEFLESKSELFKDKTTINSLISYYSKFFIKDGLFYYEKTPKIVAINKLIAYPNLAFCDENTQKDDLDNYYLTSKEFQNFLQELYNNDYILINISDIIEIIESKVCIKDLYLPLNKTPIILIFNNINYFENEPYFVEKFIIDGKDEIACYNSKQTEKNQISYNTDFIPILESFIASHNDFSFNNARSLVTIDSRGGILGYNINKNNPNAPNNASNLKKVVQKLKLLGYSFGYGNFDKNFEVNLDENLNFIKETLVPIFGNLNTYFSSFEKNKNNNYYNKLEEIGFKIFIDINQNVCSIKNNKAFLSTKLLNGNVLREKNNDLNINFEKIFEHNARTKLF